MYGKKLNISRRGFLGGATVALAAPAILTRTRAYAADPVIKIGHVSPRTGPLAGFAEADDYVLEGIKT
ncbi:MAG: twin-arginine translocation signal domain-containing protein, partial [Roseibium sp.]